MWEIMQEGNGLKCKTNGTSNWSRRSKQEFCWEISAGSEALYWMVPSKNNNRNQSNCCCELTRLGFFFGFLFFSEDSRFLHHTPTQQKIVQQRSYIPPQTAHKHSMLQAQRKQILTDSNLRNQEETRNPGIVAFLIFFFFNFYYFFMLGYGKKLSNSGHKPVAHSYMKLLLLLDIHKIPIIAVWYTQLVYIEVKNKLSTSRSSSGQTSGGLNVSFLPHNNERHAPSIIKPSSLKERYGSEKSFIMMQYNLLNSYSYRLLSNKPACF